MTPDAAPSEGAGDMMCGWSPSPSKSVPDTPGVLAGTAEWVKHAGGDGQTSAAGVAVAADGSFYVTGGFSGTATFGPGEAHISVLAAGAAGGSAFQQGADIFVAHFNPDGALVWVRHPLGSGGRNSGIGIATSNSGDVIIVGELADILTFGSGESAETTLTPVNAGDSNGFIARYHSDGTLAWAKRVGTDYTTSFRVAVGTDDGVWVVGEFRGASVFGPGELSETTLHSDSTQDPNTTDLFVARFSPGDGRLQWVQRAGGPWDDRATDVTVVGCSAIVVGGCSTPATFGPGRKSETRVNTAAPGVAFVAQYGADGAIGWVRSAEGQNQPFAQGVAAFPDGRVVVVGWFGGAVHFSNPKTGPTTLQSTGSAADIFLASYGFDGSLGWVRSAGGSGDDFPEGVAVTPSGTAVVTGYMESEAIATFGLGEANETRLMLVGGAHGNDAFFAAYGGDGRLKWANSAGASAGLTHGAAVSAAPNGGAIVVGISNGATFGSGPTFTAIAGMQDAFWAMYAAVDKTAVAP